MPSTIIGQHYWVQYTVEGVDVIVDPETELPLVVPQREETRAIGVQVGCDNCGEPLTAGSVATGCGGNPSA
jgi:hypothetical protein